MVHTKHIQGCGGVHVSLHEHGSGCSGGRAWRALVRVRARVCVYVHQRGVLRVAPPE